MSLEQESPQSYYSQLDVVHDNKPQNNPSQSLLQQQPSPSMQENIMHNIHNEPVGPNQIPEGDRFSAHYNTTPHGNWSAARILSIILGIFAFLASFAIFFNLVSTLYEMIYFGVNGRQSPLIPYTILFLFLLAFACGVSCLGIGSPIANQFNRKALAFDMASTFTAGMIWFVVCINFVNLILGITMAAAFGASVIGWVLASLFVNSFCFCGCIAFGGVTSYALWTEIPDRLDAKRGIQTVSIFQIVFYLILTFVCCVSCCFFFFSLILSSALIGAQRGASMTQFFTK